jgi:type I restriction enzyme M protein
MPSKRDVLASLTRDELLDALDRCGVEVANRRGKDGLVDALSASHRARLSEILEGLSRERLKALCRTFELDDSGRQKALLVERLAGGGARHTEQAPGARPRQKQGPQGTIPPGPTRGELSTNELEKRLWASADALRNNMDAAEYKHVVLGLIFLKYISDAFEAKREALTSERDQGADPEDPDEYRAANIFWVPKEARWPHLKASAPQPTIGTLVDDAIAAIERDNASLKDVLPKDYARPGLDKQRLGQLINLVSDVGLGRPADRAKDILGHVYEYFLAQFASAEGKKGGQFYTPFRVVRVLVEILAPYKGRVYDPCCGSGGMFVSSEKFIEAHAGKIGDIAVYGQESNYTTWRLAKMNLAIRGIDGQIAHGDTFHHDRHPDLKADYVLANPPFNDSDWRGELLKDDKRWVYGKPPAANANFAWVQHFIHHLAPTGLAGFVLANGSMSSNQSGEGEIRKNIIEADLVDCMVALPGQLFYSTQIPVCLWFLARTKKNGSFRDRRGETLFIDARKLGTMVDRVHRELTDADIARIARTYHAWRGERDAGEYGDVPGFCKTATLQEVRSHGHVLTPGRYVGAEAQEDDGEPFAEKFLRLRRELATQFAESARLEAEIGRNLDLLGMALEAEDGRSGSPE